MPGHSRAPESPVVQSSAARGGWSAPGRAAGSTTPAWKDRSSAGLRRSAIPAAVRSARAAGPGELPASSASAAGGPAPMGHSGQEAAAVTGVPPEAGLSGRWAGATGPAQSPAFPVSPPGSPLGQTARLAATTRSLDIGRYAGDRASHGTRARYAASPPRAL